MIKTTLAKLLTVKATALVAATAAGGAALAASSGTLPNPLAGPDATKPTPAHATGKPASPAAAHPSADASQGPRGNGSPSPSLVGLCQAYTAGAGNNPGAVLDNRAFTTLITAAGGKDKVTSCTTVLAAAPGKKPTAQRGKEPTHRSSPTPNTARANHPSNPPVAEITGLLTVAEGWQPGMQILARTEPPPETPQTSQRRGETSRATLPSRRRRPTRTPLPPPRRVAPQPRE